MIRITGNSHRPDNGRVRTGGHARRALNVRIHPSADVSDLARIGAGTQIWNNCQVRERVVIGQDCILGKDVYIDAGVEVGDHVKIQNGVSVYHGTTIESNVFVGPRVVFTNDKRPRATTQDGRLKGANDWTVGEIRVCHGASIGAGAIILPNVRIGYCHDRRPAPWLHDVADYALAIAGPARRPTGYVARATRLALDDRGFGYCPDCGAEYQFTGESLDRNLQTLHR